MSSFIAQRLVKLLVHADRPIKGARVGVLGLTFKEDCNDLRNSKVPDILKELGEYGIHAMIHDPAANAKEAHHEYGLDLAPLEAFKELDALVLAVSHKEYKAMGAKALLGFVRDGGVFIDVKSAFEPSDVSRGIRYYSL